MRRRGPCAARWLRFGNSGKLIRRVCCGRSVAYIVPRATEAESPQKLVAGSTLENVGYEKSRYLRRCSNMVHPRRRERTRARFFLALRGNPGDMVRAKAGHSGSVAHSRADGRGRTADRDRALPQWHFACANHRKGDRGLDHRWQDVHEFGRVQSRLRFLGGEPRIDSATTIF